MNLPQIGIVRNGFQVPENPEIMKAQESIIEVFDEFAGGLFKIELSDYIEIYFQFHKADGYRLKTHTFTGEYKGVFSTRSPRRPSGIGSTMVKLVKRDGNKLTVSGLDALDGSPVVDIKPVYIPFSDEELSEHNIDNRKMNPRKEVMSNIWANKMDLLMLNAAQIHGHFCPGLAMGVMMATKAMQMIRGQSDGMEDLLAIVETNNCVSDGIQFVTGCTFGNNALIFKDWGKTAFTLTKRDGRGIRISSRADAKAYMRMTNPLFSGSYKKVVGEQDHSDEEIARFKKLGVEKAFVTLHLDFEKLYNIEEVNVEVPPYAPSHESFVCGKCGEPVMATRIVNTEGQQFCIPCSGGEGKILTGNGIH
nr:tRNA (N6-threonylcarbamoyladenosine(37)-N6)-methyltransferase TrmO [Bacteroidota bacterium]